ncbi:MAG: TatD family hydrolase [Fusobacterium sp.]|nr:TatD family hydrolase [Fusobacterium sp.]
MNTYIVDTHSHIDMIEGISIEEVIKNAHESGVDKIIVPCAYPHDIEKINALTLQYKEVYGLLGVHPSEARDWSDDLIDKIRAIVAANPKIVGIGEIGLDYYWDKSFNDLQKEVFIKQIALANELNLPICVHDREAHLDSLNILKEHNQGSKIVMHCFSGSVEFMRECLKENIYIALGGVVTFKNAVKAKEVAAEVPLDKLLLETDAPYLTPVPFRGKENQPAYTKFVAEEIAKLRGINVEEVMRITTQNAHDIYNLGEI